MKLKGMASADGGKRFEVGGKNDKKAYK